MFSIEGFEWDKKKAEINEKKHGITFDEAITVFYDDHTILIADPDHSFYEERFLLLGRSERSNILVVVHCERDNNLRIISERKATKQETIQYGRQQ
ncbi:BrnT family toxin [Glaesserella parasuis]|uniref:BrnT family toxin n=1 Tax=Glaesserella parasuis TaxID=738 RepID=UPI0013E0B8D7|nr:BrnT family toxin [Glaesserella parasuis]MDG6448429.1 BrnT family toxin [Glaesserella parasuis]MDG6473822.1 BrnT family toxin [Glaesserella parasuis]MDG6476108.1 BrnT family toxin [Glaesserella parasuis]MDO9799141.1 BrnT family toxin [Glaesserella parasuis]MDO9851203.1 BrnT family toxin [Glaesserella parasuis]